MPSVDRGAYLLGNDRVLEWARALLASLAASNPGLPVVLIPFGEPFAQLAGLVRRGGHDVMSAPADFAALDGISARLTRRGGLEGTYRKFAAFSGPFERFLVLDADVVVTAALDPVLDRLGDFALLAAQHTADAVWRPGFGPAGEPGPGANSGIWASHRGLVSLDELRALAPQAAEVSSGLASRGEQSFFNFWLSRAAVSWQAWNHVPGCPTCLWAGDARPAQLPAAGVPPGTATIHWAGFGLSPRMPMRRLWLEHRLRDSSAGERAAYLRREPLRAAAANTGWLLAGALGRLGLRRRDPTSPG